jgi:hypothetical protein
MPFADICPSGEVIIGFSGYTTTVSPIVVSWLQPVCGKLTAGIGINGCRLVIMPGTLLPGRGRIAGMGPWSATCPANNAVVGFHGRAGFDLDQVSFECAPLGLSRNASTYVLTVGPSTSLSPQGGTTGPTYQDGCAPNGVVVGTSGQAGQIVYSLGLTCGQIAVTP